MPRSAATENSILPLTTKHQIGPAPGVDIGSSRHPGRSPSSSSKSFADGPPRDFDFILSSHMFVLVILGQDYRWNNQCPCSRAVGAL